MNTPSCWGNGRRPRSQQLTCVKPYFPVCGTNKIALEKHHKPIVSIVPLWAFALRQRTFLKPHWRSQRHHDPSPGHSKARITVGRSGVRSCHAPGSVELKVEAQLGVLPASMSLSHSAAPSPPGRPADEEGSQQDEGSGGWETGSTSIT